MQLRDKKSVFRTANSKSWKTETLWRSASIPKSPKNFMWNSSRPTPCERASLVWGSFSLASFSCFVYDYVRLLESIAGKKHCTLKLRKCEYYKLNLNTFGNPFTRIWQVIHKTFRGLGKRLILHTALLNKHFSSTFFMRFFTKIIRAFDGNKQLLCAQKRTQYTRQT